MSNALCASSEGQLAAGDRRIEQAIEALNKSERGRCVGVHLLRLFDRGGLSLDAHGQDAVFALIEEAFHGGRGGTVLWELDAKFGPLEADH